MAQDYDHIYKLYIHNLLKNCNAKTLENQIAYARIANPAYVCCSRDIEYVLIPKYNTIYIKHNI